MRMREQPAAREFGQQRRGIANTARVRYDSSDDMAGIGELAEVMAPVAVVVRQDGSLDVYGYVEVIDQREPGFWRCAACWSGPYAVDLAECGNCGAFRA